MASLVSNLIIIGGLLYVGHYVFTQTDIPSQLQTLIKGDGGGGKTAVPSTPTTGDSVPKGNLSAGAAGLLYPSTGKAWKAKDSGKTKRNYASGGSSGTTQWDIKNVGPITNLEVTSFLDVGNCGDEFSIKVYGPDHSDGNCCWLIMDVDCNTGQFMMGGEGPHPSTSKNGLGTGQSMGSMKNKEVGIKLVTMKTGSGYIAIGYAYTGGKWTEMIRKSFTQFGDKKKSSTPSGNANIQFRTDCSGVKYRIAEAAEINPSAGVKAAAMARRVYYTGQFIYPQNSLYNRIYSQRGYARVPYI